MVFLPIIFTVARRFGGSLLLYGLPTAAAFAAMHAVVPPHPGPVAAVVAMGGDVGATLLLGLPVAVIGWFIGGYLVGRSMGRRIHVDLPDLLFGEMNGGEDDGLGALRAKAPSFPTVLMLLILPLLLISLNTVVGTLQSSGRVAQDAEWAQYLILLGQVPIALLITVLVAIGVLTAGKVPLGRTSDLLDSALGPICAIILITGAGGMFGGVLRASGIGGSLTDSLSGMGLPLILQAFLIATALRVAQGSATVALTTTAGLIAAQVQAENLGDLHIALLVFAIAAGATVLSHVNDSGFWLVSRFFQMDEKTTLKTWTVLETTLGTSIFVISCLLWVVV